MVASFEGEGFVVATGFGSGKGGTGLAASGFLGTGIGADFGAATGVDGFVADAGFVPVDFAIGMMLMTGATLMIGATVSACVTLTIGGFAGATFCVAVSGGAFSGVGFGSTIDIVSSKPFSTRSAQ